MVLRPGETQAARKRERFTTVCHDHIGTLYPAMTATKNRQAFPHLAGLAGSETQFLLACSPSTRGSAAALPILQTVRPQPWLIRPSLRYQLDDPPLNAGHPLKF